MAFYRRHLPHLYEIGQPAFVTWRLHDSLPPERAFPAASLTSGRAFDMLDHLLDLARTGPLYLRQPAVANLVVEAIHYNAATLGHYVLHAFVVMPNHVHLLATPAVPLPTLTKSLKGVTAKRANAMLGLTGAPFWQQESYDRLVRSRQEFESIRTYIEQNPVPSGSGARGRRVSLVERMGDRGVACGPGGPPYGGRPCLTTLPNRPYDIDSN